MHVSFGMARHTNGICYLRYDDTNPEAEKQEYIDHIQEIVSWLGWEPFEVAVNLFARFTCPGLTESPSIPILKG